MNDLIVQVIEKLGSDLGIANYLLLLLASLAGGILSSLTPCVYPLIPITAGLFGGVDSSPKNAIRFVLSYILGISLVFSALGIVAVQGGIVFGCWAGIWWLYFIVGNVLLLSVFIMLDVVSIGWLVNRTQSLRYFNKGKSLFGFFIFGATTGLIASPCSTPILAAIIALAALKKATFLIFPMMLLYALGFSLILAALATGIIAVKRLPGVGRWLSFVKAVSVILILILAEYFLFKAGEYF